MTEKRFHRGKDGTPRPCSAQPGNCPLGGHGNFDFTQRYCDMINEAIYDTDISKVEELARKDTPENDVYRTALYEKLNREKGKVKKSIKDFKFNEYITANSGISFNPNSNEVYNNGFCMSPYPDRSEFLADTLEDKAFQDYLQEYCGRNEDLLSKPNHCLGLWREENGPLWVDISVVLEDASDCRIYGAENDQKAYFDLQLGEAITIDMTATSGQKGEYKDDNWNL